MPTGCARRWCTVGVVLVSVLAGPAAAAAAQPEVLKIKVIDAVTGKPIPGTKVYYTVWLEGGGGHSKNTPLDADGTTRLTWDGVAGYTMGIEFPGPEGVTYSLRREVLADDPGAAALTVKIPTHLYGRPLAVTVLDAATGKPVPGARLAIIRPRYMGWRYPPLQNTGAEGKVRFHGYGPGTHSLYCSRLRDHDVSHVALRRTITEAEWKAGKLTWKMDVPKVSVRVKVFRKVAGDRHPAPDGLNVALWRRGAAEGLSSSTILAPCKDGRAEFYGLTVGRTYQIISARWAAKPTVPAYVVAGAEPWKFQGKVVDLEATLIPHEEYRGRLQVAVVTEGGKAVEGAEVRLGHANQVKAMTDAKGTVAWSDLRGWYELRVYKKGFERVVTKVHLPGVEAKTITLDEARSLDVTALDAGGQPLRPERWQAVGFFDGRMRISRGRRRGDEKARLDDLRKGRYLVAASVLWIDQGSGPVPADRGTAVVDTRTTDRVTVRIRPTYAVRLEVRRVSRVRLVLVSPGENDFTTYDSRSSRPLRLLKGEYLAYMRVPPGRYKQVGRVQVTGSATIRLDIKDADLEAEGRGLTESEAMALALGPAKAATTRPAGNPASTRASK